MHIEPLWSDAIFLTQHRCRPPNSPNLFRSALCVHLTRLNFHPAKNRSFYPGFKQDLVLLFGAAHCLQYFRIFRTPVERLRQVHFPELLVEMKRNQLPKLRAFHLADKATLFTRLELNIWGSGGDGLGSSICRYVMLRT